MDAKDVASVIAVLLSAASLAIAQHSALRARKKETILNLLGEKETVAFAALKLLQKGLPAAKDDRDAVVEAVCQACVFEGSDRARALLYRVIDQNRVDHKADFERFTKKLSSTFNSVQAYSFEKEDVDLERGKRRLKVLERVIEGLPSSSRERSKYY